MSEELLQRNYLENPDRIGKYTFYNIGGTTINQLKNSGIIPNRKYKGIENKKPDGLIMLSKKVIAIIENKDINKFNNDNKRDAANNQAWTIAKVLKPKIIITTDTVSSVWKNGFNNEIIRDENETDLKVAFNHNNFLLVEKTIDKIINSISETNSTIIPLQYTNPLPLAKQVWQDVYVASSATPENCLYTFIELFIFKYLSDLGILDSRYSFKYLYDMFNDCDNDDVLEYYAKNIRPYIKKLFPESDIDHTTIINGTIFVNSKGEPVQGYSTAFKNILDKFKKFGKLENIDIDFKSKVFEVFFKEDSSKGGMGQYFTPLKVVQNMVNMADIREGMSICDPACGVGKFILEAISKNIDEFYQIKNNHIVENIHIEGYDKGFTKDTERTIILAKANMLLYFSDLVKSNPNLTKDFSALFNRTFTLKTKSVLGTLEEAVRNKFDLILTNPPYIMTGTKVLRDEISKNPILKSYYTHNGQGAEGLFIEWIIHALKVGGKALIVVPDGIFNRKNDALLRRFILDECYIDAIISLPSKTFFTTPKKTFIISLIKKNNKQDIQKYDVFCYLASSIGETLDSNRFEDEHNDLERGIQLYNIYKALKYNKNNILAEDKRCKIIPITHFYNKINDNWVIDNLWTNDEKIELKITEKDNIYSISEFCEIIKSISEELTQYEEILKDLD